MARLTGEQLKDSYQNLLTIDATIESDPLTGQLENGLGNAITALGIGTDSPDKTLHILNSDVNKTAQLKISDGSSDTSAYIGSFANTMWLTNGGTYSGSWQLDGSYGVGVIEIGSVDGGSLIRLNTASSNTTSTERMKVHSSGDISFRDGSANEAFYWDASTARLGIGNQAPTVTLDVTGDIALSNDLYISNGNFIKLQRNSGGLYLDVLGTPSGTDDVRLLTSGAFDLVNGSLTSMLKVDTSGNVGIGTSPNAFSNQTSLTVRGTSVSRIDLQGAGGSGGGVFLATATETQLGGNFNIPLKLFTSSTAGITFETNSNPRMTIDSSGNVGIGTTNPSALLSGGNVAVDVSSSNGGEFVARRSGGQANLAMGVTSGDIGYLYSTTATPMVFGTNNSEAMRIDSSGNVGIGITNPSDYFTNFNDLVVGSTSADSGITIVSSTTDDGTLAFADGTSGTAEYSGYIQYSHGTDNLSVGTSGTERMRIDSSGNLGINYNNGAIHTYGSGVFGGKAVIKASSDNALALLNSTTGGSAQVALNFTNEFTTNQYNYLARIVAKPAQAWSSDAATRDSDLIFSTTLNGVTAERMRILSGGDVSFAMQDFSASPSNTVYGLRLITGAAGKSYWKSAVNADTTHYHYEFLNTNGSVGNISTSASATAYNTSSDYRLKENVVEMTGALDRVDQLKPSRFNFIADADRTVDGFLAHEVADVVPEAITGEKDAVDDEGNPIYQSIDQSKLVPLLVGAIQELKAEIEQLKNQ